MTLSDVRWRWSDAGRKAAGLKPAEVSDCAVRSIVQVTGLDYIVVHAALKSRAPDIDRSGVPAWILRPYCRELGFRYYRRPGRLTVDAFMHRGSRIVDYPRHVFAIKDGIVYDSVDPTWWYRRKFIGYWLPSDVRW